MMFEIGYEVLIEPRQLIGDLSAWALEKVSKIEDPTNGKEVLVAYKAMIDYVSERLDANG